MSSETDPWYIQSPPPLVVPLPPEEPDNKHGKAGERDLLPTKPDSSAQLYPKAIANTRTPLRRLFTKRGTPKFRAETEDYVSTDKVSPVTGDPKPSTGTPEPSTTFKPPLSESSAGSGTAPSTTQSGSGESRGSIGEPKTTPKIGRTRPGRISTFGMNPKPPKRFPTRPDISNEEAGLKPSE